MNSNKIYKNKQMKKIFLFVLLGVFSLSTSMAKKDKKSATEPNFIIIYMDDLGWADTSVPMMDGEPLSKSDFYITPQLEKLAERGVRFSNGYCPTPTCTGSRISIQFGMTSARMQYRNVNDVLSKKQRGNTGWDDDVSMAAVVKAANNNYITAHFGKGMSVRRMDHAGYDVTDEYDTNSNGNGHGSFIDVKNKIPIPDDNAKRIPDLTRLSVDFVKEHAGKQPFYMMISHYAVHVPFQASPEAIERARQRWLAMGRPDVDTNDPEYKNSKEYRTWQYAGMIEQCDNNLGALVEALKQTGELDNTYIIYTSDNGGGYARRDEHKRRFNGPLQEGKRSTLEGGLRVPFVVAGPGIEPGSQCDVPVVQWDLLSTLHDLSGSKAPLPKGVDGGSLRDLFERGNKGTVKRGAPGLIFHYTCHYHPPVSVIRIGDYKLMRHLNSDEMKLFNVAEDYREQKDLASTMPKKVAELNRIRQQYIDEVDGGKMEDVYAVFLEIQDENKINKEKKYLSDIEKLQQKNPADFKVQKAKLDASWEHEKRKGIFAREKCKAQMKDGYWYETDRIDVSKKLGFDKQGNVISKK
jgi:arylsulfatase A-like enzyme